MFGQDNRHVRFGCRITGPNGSFTILEINMPLAFPFDVEHVDSVHFLDEGLTGDALDAIKDRRYLSVDLIGLATETSAATLGQL